MNTERPDNDDAADEAGGGRPARRRPRAVAVASVAAAVLLMGGGGAYLATSATGDDADGGTASGAPGDDTPPPLPLDDHGASSPEGGPNGIAPGEPDPHGVTYRADGPLPEGPGSAPVYRAKGDVTEAEVARLAEALGVEGAPRTQGEAWKAGNAKDGSGPLLTVSRRAPGTWTFHRYAPGTDNCKKGPVCKAPPADGNPVGEAAAKKAAAPVLKALGQDDAKLDASQVMGAGRAVNAEPEVGGLPTYGWTTGIVVGAQGEVIGGSGRMKAPVKGDTYPVLNAEETLALLNAPGAGSGADAGGVGGVGGIGGCASPVPHQDGADTPCGPPTGAPERPGAGKRQTATVEDAVFGLAAHPVRGQQTLVPSWLFQVRAPGARDAVTVTYPAVEPRFLTTAAPATPPTSPSAPDEPTAGPGEPRDVRVSGYTAADGELTVHFTGGVCSDYDAKAKESGGKVTVTVTETPHPDQVCILIAKEYERTVPLDEPLGDRTVVGSDGKDVPVHKPGARLPAPSGAG